MKVEFLTQFTELGLSEPVLKALTAEGYTDPTPIQAQAIPALMAGRDLLGTAQTGTGKTAAFTLPVLDAIVKSTSRAQNRSCTVLILAPTRELALQIAESVKTYGRYVRPTIAVVMGGVKPGAQIRTMQRGVDVLIATPGRLLDHMGTGAINLQSVKTVILDEADQMMDLGFMPAIRRVMAATPKDRQTSLFSATMPKPIRTLAHDFLTDPVQISVASESRPIEQIEQSVQFLERSQKLERLVKVLSVEEMTSGIVFTRTKRGADKVCQRLTKAGLAAETIHGNKSQNQRQRALDAFKRSKCNILVATDIAARGIDVDGVSHVVNYELPNVPESYVHRIGRTARAGKTGIAIAFCDGEEKSLLKDIERLIGYRLAVTNPDGSEQHPTKPFTEEARGPAPKKSARPRGGRNRTRKPRPEFAAGERSSESRPQGERRPKPATGQGEFRKRSDKPRNDRPRAKTENAKPQGQRPQGERAFGKPHAGTVRGERSQGQSRNPEQGKRSDGPGNDNAAPQRFGKSKFKPSGGGKSGPSRRPRSGGPNRRSA
ncbi:MAG: DEAD/DEAH box helicase [Hyphobacterium sp.]|nr:MAG: DEAD/DEAH box helicase [Hyphobacterium sp.]